MGSSRGHCGIAHPEWAHTAHWHLEPLPPALAGKRLLLFLSATSFLLPSLSGARDNGHMSQFVPCGSGHLRDGHCQDSGPFVPGGSTPSSPLGQLDTRTGCGRTGSHVELPD